MAIINGWTVTPHDRWMTTDGRLIFFRNQQYSAWEIVATIYDDYVVLHDAQLIGNPCEGMSLRQLAAMAASVTGASGKLQRQYRGEYFVEEAGLVLARAMGADSWVFKQAWDERHMSIQYWPLVGHREFRTRAEAIGALSTYSPSADGVA